MWFFPEKFFVIGLAYKPVGAPGQDFGWRARQTGHN
jgi:hypothetical protein